MTTILFIDDEPKIRTFVRISLQSEGYEFYEASSARQGLMMAEQLSPDLIILDLGLPDSDGLSVIQKLRQRQSNPPIIVLSARDDEDVKITALDLGANDYLCKPFGVRELLARIRVLLRDLSASQMNSDIPSVMRFNALEINLLKHQVTLNQSLVNLTPKEYELLYLLAQQPQKLLEHDYLLTRLWGHQHRHNTQYLRVCVSQLRKKLNDDSEHPQFIETVPALGYRFIPAPTN
ncbi:response regulator [Pseudidiomarina andamanensis]|uniref:DNA-binding response regulator n=1 Tax=Pseudidiomarina andamanensis TaxID=1940690 RepID=A0AA92ILB3_9GAMM|nr:response regulator transcription factor [Pseudidiomarina andamanensis]MDS0218198.1 response regulator transcription factor [Pseudidiomarina andamanensis]QGT95084.1 DNA-binding response regulator [Pseudidiomarina andamanensis]